MMDKIAYKDNGEQSFVPASGTYPGMTLGCTAKERFAVVLEEHGFKEIADALKMGGSIADALSALMANESPEPAKVVSMLSADERSHVRAELAAHLPRYVPGIFEMLGTDPRDSVVRRAIACNSNTPELLLRRLKEDRDELVRMAALGLAMKLPAKD